jgi:lipoyl(octanoyl) transferase
MRFGRLALFCDVEAFDAASNMAFDEALFWSCDRPTLRCYRWLRPSVSFGYFSAWDVVFERYPDRDLVRRWTGGGIVEHGEDFTYSLTLPTNETLPRSRDLYRLIHQSIAETLQLNGQLLEIASEPDANTSDACFERTVEFDLKLNNLKIAGAAIRRHRTGLLLQGSIQRVHLAPGFAQKLAVQLSNQVETFRPSLPVIEFARRLATQKYSSTEWNRRR